MGEFKAKLTHCGQHRRYGDFFREWDVKTTATREETIEWCFQNLYTRRVPHATEFRKNTVYGGEKSHDMSYYFAGYYDLQETENGFKFIICEPYAD